MTIKILGSGCPKCKKLEANASQAVSNLEADATICKVSDYPTMISYGIMSTPALVINEKVVSSGKLLSVQEIEALIMQNK